MTDPSTPTTCYRCRIPYETKPFRERFREGWVTYCPQCGRIAKTVVDKYFDGEIGRGTEEQNESE